MCGINLCPADRDISRMNEAISHRGLPGRSGTWSNSVFSIGHVRLPILGLSDTYDQPFQSKGAVMAFAGEIFNFQNFDPYALCDTPILMNMYRESGPTALRYLDGFWSFIYYDRSRPTRVEVVTDDLAKKPLYVHLPTLSVSSEIRALAILDDLKELDPLYFSSVAKWGYHVGDRTYLKNVRKLPASTVTTIDYSSMTMQHHPWGGLAPDPSVNLREAITKAVNLRMLADVPVSLLLSGGLDSSIIFKLMVEKTTDFTVFHVDNEESEFLNYLNIPSKVRVEKIGFDDLDLATVLRANEGPVDLGSMLPQYALGQAIKKRNPEAKVIITGDGADELFGGYRRMSEYDAQYSDIFEELVMYHLPRLDKMSMAHTLELRSPFLSRPVIQKALSIPYELRKNKMALKVTFIDLIPTPIIQREKHPLKSKQVLYNPKWRHELIGKFKEVVHEHKRRG